MEPSDALHAFRCSLYECLPRRGDALFELTDAILTAGSVPSPVHLSLAAVHRRGWGSLYAALGMGRMDEGGLSAGLALSAPSRKLGPQLSPNLRCGRLGVAPMRRGGEPAARGYYYHPSRHSAGQPIVAGWAYQLVAPLGFDRDPLGWHLWTPEGYDRGKTPRRSPPSRCGLSLVERLPEPEAVPIFVFDAGYDPVKLQRALEGCPARILLRLHSNRVFYAAPEEVEPRPVGRPRRHGKRFSTSKTPRVGRDLPASTVAKARTTG